MPKRLRKIVANPKVDLVRLRKELGKRKKAELIDALMELAKDDHKVYRQLNRHFDIATPPDELVAATHDAIARATAYDEREVNHNFDYDFAAYEEVKRNFGRLVATGQLREVMDLSVELMAAGSEQVEMSDEGLMTDDIEECLEVPINAIKKSDLSTSDLLDWCHRMKSSDRVGFICDEELNALQKLKRKP
jgi:hypothetical protein